MVAFCPALTDLVLETLEVTRSRCPAHATRELKPVSEPLFSAIQEDCRGEESSTTVKEDLAGDKMKGRRENDGGGDNVGLIKSGADDV